MPVSIGLCCRRRETSESRKGRSVSPASIGLTEQPSNAMPQAYSQPIGTGADEGEPLRHVMSPYERVRVVDAVAIELELGRVVRS
jgi:hypothetical protein